MRSLIVVTCLILLVATGSWGQDKGFDAPDERLPRSLEERKRRDEQMARQPTSEDGGVTVNELVLDPILDDTFGLRYEERDAYFRILELAWHTQLSQQEEFAHDFRLARKQSNPAFAKVNAQQLPILSDMLNHPDDFRGRPVTIHGVLRKLTRFDPGRNTRNIGDVYEAWIYSNDSRVKNPDDDDLVIPTVVVFQGKPDGLEVGGDLSEEVRVTGYFFKLYRYEAQDRVWKAPLLLAGSVEWKKHEPYRAQALGAEVYLLMGMTLAMLGFVWWQGHVWEMTSGLRPVESDVLSLPMGLAETHDS